MGIPARGTFGLFLGVLEHDDILRDPVGLGVVLVHVSAKGNHVNRVEAPAVEIKESDDIERCDLGVEGVGILQVVVPHLIHDVAEKFGASTLSGFVVRKVLEFGFVCCFRFDTDDSSGIV